MLQFLSTRRFLSIPAASSFALAAFVGAFPASAQELPTAPRLSIAEQVAHKRQQLETVVAELSLRDVSDLTSEQRAARNRALALLGDYAARERFTQSPFGPIPEFIDAQGTRCALATLLEGFGREDLLSRLARECNDDYLAAILDDQELLAAVASLGLSLDEAAFIQGPGVMNDDGTVSGGGMPSGGGLPVVDDTDTTQTNQPRTKGPADVVSGAGGGRGPASPSGNTPPPARTPGVGGRGRGPMTRRGGEGVAPATWQDWWALNREAYVGVRSRYHDHLAVTRSGASTRAPRPLRPSDDDITAQLLPLFQAIYRSARDPDVEATALAMEARVVEEADKPRVAAEIFAFLADPNQPDRFWGLIALAMLAHDSAVAPLAELVADTPAGRKLLAQTAPVNETWRSYAAFALARSGGGCDKFELILSGKVEAGPELKSACVVALGVIGQRPAERVGAVTALLRVLADDHLPTPVRAQAPIALATMGDAAAFPALFDVVAKFRGPRELRQSSAQALGRLAPAMDETTVEALIALARRDTDPDCRHAAIVALGELAWRCADPADAEQAGALGLLADFHHDALLGRFRQTADLPWHALSAALFACRVDTVGARTGAELLDQARTAGDVGTRAAAVLALGLLGRAEANEPLRALLGAGESGAEESVAAWTAEALGLLGNQEARAPLLELCLTSASEEVRYHAAIGLGYLADPSVLAPLLNAFEKTNSASVRAGLARALGEIGDKAAMVPLARLAADDGRDGETRQRALAALGVLGQRDDAAWNLAFKRGANVTLMTPSLRTVLGSF